MPDSLNTRNTLLMKIRDQYDDQSWEDFVTYYRGYILVVLKNMKINSSEREDLLQDILLKAWKSLPTFNYDKGKGRFRGWLATITKNTVYNQIRSKSRRVEGSVVDGALEDHLSIAGTDAEIELMAKREWENYIAEMAWENIKDDLAENVRQVFLLFMEDKESADIAAELEIEVNSVYVYKKRVRKLLLKEILRLDQELG